MDLLPVTASTEALDIIYQFSISLGKEPDLSRRYQSITRSAVSVQ